MVSDNGEAKVWWAKKYKNKLEFILRTDLPHLRAENSIVTAELFGKGTLQF
jgi:hypothetical protein